MDHLLTLLRAAAEDTRLRILALAAREDLTVSDYVHVLGQSQPRVSRHLKLLVEAGLLERFREAQFTRFRLVTSGDDAGLVREFVRRLDPKHARIAADRARFQMETPQVVAERLVFVEGLALLRLAEVQGLRTQREYLYCPANARLRMRTPVPSAPPPGFDPYAADE